MTIPLAGGFSLSPVAFRDEAACIEHLRERAIAEQTVRIPFPYTAEHAQHWLLQTIHAMVERGEITTFAIRNAEGGFIGVVSLDRAEDGDSAEAGYWIARPYWGRGIATSALEAITRYGFNALHLRHIHAHVFASNPASMRVLEKCGFTRKAYLPGHFTKHGRRVDAVLYTIDV